MTQTEVGHSEGLGPTAVPLHSTSSLNCPPLDPRSVSVAWARAPIHFVSRAQAQTVIRTSRGGGGGSSFEQKRYTKSARGHAVQKETLAGAFALTGGRVGHGTRPRQKKNKNSDVQYARRSSAGVWQRSGASEPRRDAADRDFRQRRPRTVTSIGTSHGDLLGL